MDLLIVQITSVFLLLVLGGLFFYCYKLLVNLQLRALRLKKGAGHVSSVVSEEFFKRLSFHEKKKMVENIVSKGTETITNITAGILSGLAESQKVSDRARRIKEAAEKKKEAERLESLDNLNESGSGI